MGNKANFFQLALLIFFGLTAVASVLYISIYKRTGDTPKVTVPIVIWGPPVTESAIVGAVDYLSNVDENYKKIKYISKNPYTIYGDLLEAIATGVAPDIVVLNSSGLLALKNKLYPISFDVFPYNTYRDTWVEGSEVFVLQEKIYALPLLVDPLVLYWNRDLFTNAAIAQPPKDWVTFKKMVPRLSTIVGDTDLVQSAVAFGEYDNVLHSKEILSAMLMQTGISIVDYDSTIVYPSFGGNAYHPEAAIDFYTAFSNPANSLYSWNKTFDRSREAFASNRVAMYGGFISEETTLQDINPNLNYGISTWPQSDNNFADVTYGNFYGLGIIKTSKNPALAFQIAALLTGSEAMSAISSETNLLPVRNDLLTNFDTSDPNGQTKVRSAIMAKTWLEPAPNSAVDESFSRAINSVVSGNNGSKDAVKMLLSDITELLKRYNN